MFEKSARKACGEGAGRRRGPLIRFFGLAVRGPWQPSPNETTQCSWGSINSVCLGLPVVGVGGGPQRRGFVLPRVMCKPGSLNTSLCPCWSGPVGRAARAVDLTSDVTCPVLRAGIRGDGSVTPKCSEWPRQPQPLCRPWGWQRRQRRAQLARRARRPRAGP